MARVTVSVHVRNATATGLRSVRNSINNLNRGLLMGLAGAMSDGIGQGLANGLRQAANNPYVASAILTLAAALVMQVGAALAAALTLAFGGAFIALGVMAAKGAKEVQRNWAAELKDLKSRFKEAAEPLIPVLHRAAHVMGDLGRKFAPEFKKAMQEAAPFLDRFLDEMARGIEKFGQNAFDPMMDSFNKLLEAIDWEGFFEDLGKAFGNLGATVSRHTSEVAGAFEGLLSILPRLINLVALLTEGWARVKPWFDLITGIVVTALTPAFEILKTVMMVVFQLQSALIGPLSLLHRIMKAFYEEAMVPIGDFISTILAPIWNGLVEGFKEGWRVLEKDLVPVLRDLWDQLKGIVRETLALVPGFEGLADKSQTAGQVLKEWVIDKLTALGEWIREHREELLQVGEWIAKGIAAAIAAFAALFVAFVTLVGWIDRAWELFLYVTGIDAVIRLIDKARELWNWVARNWRIDLLTLGPNLQALINKVRELWGWVSRNWKIDVFMFAPGATGVISAVSTLWSWVNRSWSRNVNFHFSVSGAIDTIRRFSGFAHGGVVGRAATGGARSNMTLVGEQGPELVNLAPGSHVRSNPDSRRIMGQGGGGGGSTLVLKSSGRRVDDLLIEVLREAIHQRGGDPVTVLGGR